MGPTHPLVSSSVLTRLLERLSDTETRDSDAGSETKTGPSEHLIEPLPSLATAVAMWHTVPDQRGLELEPLWE